MTDSGKPSKRPTGTGSRVWVIKAGTAATVVVPSFKGDPYKWFTGGK